MFADRAMVGLSLDSVVEEHRRAIGRALGARPLPWGRAATVQAVSDLLRFGVHANDLVALGPRGTTLAKLLESCEDCAITWPKGDWTIGYELLGPAEVDHLARVTQGVGLAAWRGTANDPAAARIVGSVEPLTPLAIEAGCHFPDPEAEVDWVMATIAREVREGGLTPSRIRILIPQDAIYPALLGHAARLVGLRVRIELPRPARTTPAGRLMADTWEFVATGRVPGDPRRTALLDQVPIPSIPSDGASRTEWLSWWQGVLAVVVPSVASELTLPPPGALQDGSPTLTRARFGQELAETLGHPLPAPEDEMAIDVLPIGAPSTRTVELAIQLGATEDRFPLLPAPNPALPLDLRRRLPGLPRAAELVRAARVATLGAMAAPRIIVTAPRRIGTAVVGPSPFLADLGCELRAAPDRPVLGRFANAIEDRDSTEAGLLEEMRQREDARIAGQLEEGVVDPPPGPPAHHSVTSLVRMGQCPFAWLARRRLRLPESPPEPLARDPRVEGTLAHKVLETHATAATDVDAGVLAEELEAIVQEKGDLHWLAALPTWPLLRRQLARRLSRALTDPALRDGIVDTEPETRVEGTIEGIDVVAILDRLDKLQDGTYRIVDYKTARSVGDHLKAQDDEGRLRVHLQLETYRILVESARALAVPKIAYYLLGKGALEEVKPGTEAARRLLQRLSSHLTQQRFPVAPDVDGKACHRCEFVSCCRIRARRAS